MDQEKIIDTFKCLWMGSGHAPETGIRFIDRVIHFILITFVPIAFVMLLGYSSGLLFWAFVILCICVIEGVLYLLMKFAKDDDVYIRQEDIDKYDRD